MCQSKKNGYAMITLHLFSFDKSLYNFAGVLRIF